MEGIRIPCPAKINLSLDVVGKRDDGYHLLRMLMQSVTLYDYVTVEKIRDGIELTCSRQDIACDKSNTAYKMACLILDKYNIDYGVKIHIEKHIPVGAGLAGGSTDAAGVIKAMNQLFNLNMSLQEMLEIGLKVGADVPYCIMGGTALAEGIGEKLTPLRPLKRTWCVIAKPEISISTKEAYGALRLDRIIRHPATEQLIGYINSDEIKRLASGMVNVLEDACTSRYPEIYEIRKLMQQHGAMGSMMTGSGSAVFGLFQNRSEAERCSNALKGRFREVFLVETC